MYSQDMLSGRNFSVLGSTINNGSNDNNNATNKDKKPRVYLDSALIHHQNSKNQVLPLMHGRKHAFDKGDYGVVYDNLKPMLISCRVLGILPISFVRRSAFKLTVTWLVYSLIVVACVSAYICYIKLDHVGIVRNAEGRFEEAVIDYLFTVYLIPIVLCPLSWYECGDMNKVFNDWLAFEKLYKKITGRALALTLNRKPLVLVILLPLLSIGTMIVTHSTMANFLAWKVLPYCYVNTVTYMIGGMWYIHCDAIGKVATMVADHFQVMLRHIGPSGKVADYRSLWMLLSRITRGYGTSCCYVLIFLCLYLFLVITLTIYGLLSQIQEGFGIKDIGLTITATTSIAFLYFICDEAHYASNSITMFLRATEMNPTEMSLGGFFDVNRNLFKSISLPKDGELPLVIEDDMETTTASYAS